MEAQLKQSLKRSLEGLFEAKYGLLDAKLFAEGEIYDTLVKTINFVSECIEIIEELFRIKD